MYCVPSPTVSGLAPSRVVPLAGSASASRRSFSASSTMIVRARSTTRGAHATGVVPRVVSFRRGGFVSPRGKPSRPSAPAMAAGPKGVGESFGKFGRDLVNDLAVRIKILNFLKRGKLPGINKA